MPDALVLDPLTQSPEEQQLADEFAAAKASGKPPSGELVTRANSSGFNLRSEKFRVACIVASHNHDVRSHLFEQRRIWKFQGLSDSEISIYEVHNLLWKLSYENQVIGDQNFPFWTWAHDVPFAPPLTATS